jgi:uncharacterized membrane protein YphA (DoxX/SURF4 family)
MKTNIIIIWILRVAAALIMVQSLFFKFSAAPESVYIFSTLGMEPWGRIGTGVVELVAAILLVIPSLSWLGALVGLGMMTGAILSHLTKLGVEVAGDGGQLFIYALITWMCCAAIVLIEKQRLKAIIGLSAK